MCMRSSETVILGTKHKHFCMSCPAKQAFINEFAPNQVMHGKLFFSLTCLAASVICSSTLVSSNEVKIE